MTSVMTSVMTKKILRVEYLALRVTLVGLGKAVPVKHQYDSVLRGIYTSLVANDADDHC